MSETTTEERREPLADERTALEHGMTAEEYARVVDVLGRQPTLTELGMYSVMWSEHCSYKSSRVHLQTLPTEGERVLQGPGENAGALDLGDGLAGVFKVESHNHPSYIEPYQGAATGVGGILRDIFTMGARPLALLDSLRFGSLERARNRYLLDGVVGGIAGYGNCIGVPTVGGEIYFDPAYDHNPLVNVMCFGVAPVERVVLAEAEGVGNPVIYVGAKTGRDGIYGVSLLASAEFDAGAAEKRPAVQVGDPFTEKLLLESCLELIDRDLVVGMQDMGGAGLSCSSCEMSSKSGTGMEVDVSKVPVRESGMIPYEIMLSESQERMLLVCDRDSLDEVVEVFERWGLHAVEVGRVTDDGMVRVLDGDRVVAEVPAASLADDAPVYERPIEASEAPPALGADELAWPPPGLDVEAGAPADEGSGATDDAGDTEPSTTGTDVELHRRALLRLLEDPCIASKRWVFQQYDQTVRTNTVQRPGGDAAVIRLKESGRAVALALDGNPFYTALDAERGAELAVAEACRNVACTGARPLGITNCLNFGNPEVPRTMGHFAAAVRGMGRACRALEVPVTGGNVSFYNETEKRPILPTPVVGALGLLEDERASVPAAFRAPGDVVVLLGARVEARPGEPGGPPDPGLGGSAYVRVLHGGRRGAPPGIDLDAERRLQRLLEAAARRGLLQSAHDCSDGGLAVALAEACFGGLDRARADARGAETAPAAVAGAAVVGVDVELGVVDGTDAGRPDLRLFGEASTRVVASVGPEALEALLQLADEHDVPASRLGRVTGAAGASGTSGTGGNGPATLRVGCGGETVLEARVDELYEAWGTALARALARVATTA